MNSPRQLSQVVSECTSEYGGFDPESFAFYWQDNGPFSLIIGEDEFFAISESAEEVLDGIRQIMDVAAILWHMESRTVWLYPAAPWSEMPD